MKTQVEIIIEQARHLPTVEFLRVMEIAEKLFFREYSEFKNQ